MGLDAMRVVDGEARSRRRLAEEIPRLGMAGGRGLPGRCKEAPLWMGSRFSFGIVSRGQMSAKVRRYVGV
jgi:hypothetical protein